MPDRFMVDDAGSLVDLETGRLYDYFEEVLPVLNELGNEKESLQLMCKRYEAFLKFMGYDVHDVMEFARNGEND